MDNDETRVLYKGLLQQQDFYFWIACAYLMLLFGSLNKYIYYFF